MCVFALEMNSGIVTTNLGPDYMANFIPAETSARLTGMKFQPGFCNKSFENQSVDYMEKDSARGAIQPRLKILARFENTGLGFSARPNGLKNPCNRYHFFSPG